MPLIGRVGKEALRLHWNARTADDNRLVKHLADEFTDSSQELLEQRRDMESRLANTYPQNAPEPVQISTWLLQSRMLLHLSTKLQLSLQADWSRDEYEVLLYMWRVLDDAATGLAWKAQELLAPGLVATPYEVCEQPESFLSRQLELKAALDAGQPVFVWRLLFLYGNRPQWSPFWRVGNLPVDVNDADERRSFLDSMGVDRMHEQGRPMICYGQLRPNATFVVRAAPPMKGSAGGGEELVTTFDGVEHLRSDHLEAGRETLLRPLREHP